MTTSIVETLLNSSEPSVRYRTRVDLLGEREEATSLEGLRQEIAGSSRVRDMLSSRDNDRRLPHSSRDCAASGHARNVPLKQQGPRELWLGKSHRGGAASSDRGGHTDE